MNSDLGKEMAGRIDHTILKAEANPADVERLCREAVEYGFASVCVNPCFVSLVSEKLKGSNVLTCSVIGFPLGTNTTEIKAAETRLAVEQGAHEIDMVVNVGKLKSGDLEYVENDIRAVVEAAGNSEVKVIIETCLLSEEEKIAACKLSMAAGAAFVKTSTGFGSGGATTDDIRLMRKTVGDSMKIKASGGIKNYEDARSMVEAGADRIGASAGIVIVEGAV